jgi:hypothetical protein
MSPLLSLAVLLILAACAGAPPDVAQNSPVYQEGFADGCATQTSGVATGQRVDHRNQALFNRDPDYRAGWTSGLATCGMGSAMINGNYGLKR